ncbi:MAG: hypothetical protein LBT96_03295 [Campylobacteraceae bacterium]|jgi:hypothetical protein|nr:hypothetical protein [Campylobacteraceae bacterium]
MPDEEGSSGSSNGGSGDNCNSSSSAYCVSFYNKDLNLVYAVLMDKNTNINPSNIVSGSWYKAGASEPSTGHRLNDNINFYATSKVVEITTQEELAAIGTDATTLNRKYILLNDIGLTGGKGFDSNGWIPIGSSASNVFTGIFNGNHHKITNLWISRRSTNYVGFFGYINNAQIKNLRVEAAAGQAIIGNDDVGGIVGHIYDNSTITGSYFNGNIEGSNYVGGIIGYAGSSYAKGDVRITDSSFIGNINANSNVGGIVGKANNVYMKITNSSANANIENSGIYVGGIAGYIPESTTATRHFITGSHFNGGIISSGSNGYVGGIVGYGGSLLIMNSYANGNVRGHADIGGIIGKASHSVIVNSYASVNVRGSGMDVGGIAGFVSNSNITNSYATGNVISTNCYVGGIAGTLDEVSMIRNSYASGNVSSSNTASVSHIGGIVGYIFGTKSQIINNVAINQYVKGQINSVNRIVGYFSSVSYLPNLAFSGMGGGGPNGFTHSNNPVSHGDSRSQYDLRKRDTYKDINWRFNENGANSDNAPWEIDENNGYPYLYWQK